MSLVLLKPELDVWKPGEHNGTFRGNNHAFVTATAALEHYWRTDAFANEIAAKGEHLRAAAAGDGRALLAGDVVEVKGRGMMIGVRCADPKRAAAVTAKAYKYGLIIERAGPEDEVIKCMMPLTTTYAELDEAMDILEPAHGRGVRCRRHVPQGGVDQAFAKRTPAPDPVRGGRRLRWTAIAAFSVRIKPQMGQVRLLPS